MKQFFLFLSFCCLGAASYAEEPVSLEPAPVFNRAPLIGKPYAELPLGEIQPEGWLRDELSRMASGMTGHLDEWYPEVCGPRNAWLGGDGDTWERGPYWIDGLYPLAKLLGDKTLEAKAMQWVEWTLNHQRENGQIGPYAIEAKDRTRPAPPGTQVTKADDWWPRMVMLKILKQHYQATGDKRVIECLQRYFRYQLQELPHRPLYDPSQQSGTWWAAQRGGENLMLVLWFYNITGEKYLLDLAELISKQTVPVTDWFSTYQSDVLLARYDRCKFYGIYPFHGTEYPLHCVNLAMMLKTPIVRWQQDRDPRHLEVVENAFANIQKFHGQPNGLFGGDELLHGDSPDRGSELCTAVEMMFSLEKMFEITGNPIHGDRLERVAYNALPTQCTDDYHRRQYFQQTNQVQCTWGARDFFEDNGSRVVYGLLQGYPCCTCNLHQGWPKFVQHLWLASRDGGIAALAYAPSSVTTKVADGQPVTLRMKTGYPFTEDVAITVSLDHATTFPLHLRIPGWAEGAKIVVNDNAVDKVEPGKMHVIVREWQEGDKVQLRFPMPLRSSVWYARAKAIERGPLVYALDIAERWEKVDVPLPKGVEGPSEPRAYLEVYPESPWNYALVGPITDQSLQKARVEVAGSIPDNPWTRQNAPVKIVTQGVRLPDWTLQRNSAAPPPLSPVPMPSNAKQETIRLIPYGATTLRVTEFPWVKQAP